MRISTLLLALIAAPALLTAQCDGERYREFVFDSFAKTADILYGSNYDFNENLQDLYLDVYTPNGDTETARPLVILLQSVASLYQEKAARSDDHRRQYPGPRRRNQARSSPHRPMRQRR